MDRPERQTNQNADRATGFLGTEGTRPYAGAGWYYAAYRDRVCTSLIADLARQLDLSPFDRVLDLGAGPGQLSLLIAPYVAQVVAIEPEPDMLTEGEKRARIADLGNVIFVAGSSDELREFRSSLGRFRVALMGQSFHWMVDQDRVLEDLSAMIDEADGAIALVTPRRVSIPEELIAVQSMVQEILERYLAHVPAGPHPSGRHDPFDDILRRSPFPRLELIESEYETRIHPTIESLIGYEYTMSHVLTRLGNNRVAFEREVRDALSWYDEGKEFTVRRRDEALLGRR
jgi:SAM-dependent methyltransferase